MEWWNIFPVFLYQYNKWNSAIQIVQAQIRMSIMSTYATSIVLVSILEIIFWVLYDFCEHCCLPKVHKDIQRSLKEPTTVNLD